MTDQTTDPLPTTTTTPVTAPAPAPAATVDVAPASAPQQQGQRSQSREEREEEERERRRRLQLFENLSPAQKFIMSLLMFFFGRFQSAEAEEEANGGHPDQDQRFQDLNRTFQSILGMDDRQYTQFKQDMRRPGTDWHDRVDTSRVDFKKADEFTKNPPKSLLDLISRHESGGDYNVVYGGKHVNLTSMTINEVLAWQKDYVRHGSPSSAAGRYQFLSNTLDGLKKELHLSGNEKFDEAMQDRLATRLLERRGLNEFMSGRISQDQFQKNLAMEWASLPKDSSGRSYYAGDGLNKALTSPRVVQSLLAEVKSGSTSPTGTQFNGAASGAAPTALASNTPDRTPGAPAPAPGRNA